MTNTPELGQRRKINWLNVNTVLSAAILIGAEVFGAAYAGGWAVANLIGLGDYGILGPARDLLRRSASRSWSRSFAKPRTSSRSRRGAERRARASASSEKFHHA